MDHSYARFFERYASARARLALQEAIFAAVHREAFLTGNGWTAIEQIERMTRSLDGSVRALAGAVLASPERGGQLAAVERVLRTIAVEGCGMAEPEGARQPAVVTEAIGKLAALARELRPFEPDAA